MSAAPPPVRRNDPCPCGSGRRYKECHGKLGGVLSIEGLVGRALQAHQRGEVDAAERIYRDILAREPANPVATHYLGLAAWQRGDAREGERLMRQSLALNAAVPDFHNNLGLLLRDGGRREEALACYRKALEVDPGWFEAYNNLGLTLEDAGRFEEALEAYASAVAREPRFAAARQNRARVLLALGRYAEGWEEYRWRLVAQGITAMPPDPNARPLPATLEGRRFELVSEQGIGDALFFLRFAPELVQRGARLAFHGDARLAGMLSRTGLFRETSGQERIFIGDLPWLLQANDASRFPPPLALAALAEQGFALRERLEASGPRPRVALTWRAGTASAGPVRSQLKEIPLDELGRALRGTPSTWISVQRFPRAGERETLAESLGAPVHDYSSANDDLEEMLALLALVHGYVGVSNANTHLSAGLGVGQQVLVPFPPEWRWGCHGEASPWFPAMRVTRQAPGGAWPLQGLGRILAGSTGLP